MGCIQYLCTVEYGIFPGEKLGCKLELDAGCGNVGEKKCYPVEEA